MFTQEQIDTFSDIIALYKLGGVDCSNNSEDEATLEAYNIGLSITYERNGIRRRSLTGEFYSPAYVVNEVVGFEENADIIDIATELTFLDAVISLVAREHSRKIRQEILEMNIEEAYYV